jgi:hypothetical protein
MYIHINLFNHSLYRRRPVAGVIADLVHLSLVTFADGGTIDQASFECPFLQSQSVERPANRPYIQSVSAFLLALVISGELAQFHSQCRRCIFGDKVRIQLSTHLVCSFREVVRSNVHSYKVKASRDQPIVRTCNLFQPLRLALVISGELPQFRFQSRRCVFVDEFRLKFRHTKQYILSSPNQINSNSTSLSMLSDWKTSPR